MTIRKEIIEFAAVMEEVMSKHDDVKGDTWKDMTSEKLYELFSEEIEETKPEDTTAKEFADVACFCMMLFHKYREEEEKDGKDIIQSE